MVRNTSAGSVLRGRRALVLAGRGRYEDPWHDHAAMSHEIAVLLGELGLRTEVRSTFRDSFSDLDAFDLLVVNGGTGRIDPDFDGDDESWAPVHAAMNAYASSGGPLFVHHQGINAFLDNPRWRYVVGGRWIRGTTYHPENSEGVWSPVAGSHPIVDGLGELHVHDERYTLLDVEPDSTVILTQHEAGADQPAAWVNTVGGMRVVYDSLGHDLRSMLNPDRRELMCREISWLLEE
ncbi:ThuA domain-containing protein [Actinomyces sp. Z5]|uniref:Trehalose utilisation n=2 Tax=Actinomycetaceae TaxID=2049 RepID=A0A1M4S3Y7_9ACTO|nr:MULTISPECIES: ThuA domain-containing protein [Actinomyces]RAX20070.1 ThuA domain-containing protein [Actinomyces sp. Z5]SHE26727.1 trehalose utilisation [Actinomyces glycerinitolerans]